MSVTRSEKLHPNRFAAMRPNMKTISGYVLGWTEPGIRWMSVTTDGHVTIDSGLNGEAADLNNNLCKLLIAQHGEADLFR